MQIGARIRNLAAASLVALAIVSIPVSSAHAEPNTGGGGGGTKTCTDPDGKQQPAGTIWTSTTLNGQVASKYKCNGKTGEWDKVPINATTNGGGILAPRATGGVLSR